MKKIEDLISVKDSFTLIEEVWKKYKEYPKKWQMQRLLYIMNKKYIKKAKGD